MRVVEQPFSEVGLWIVRTNFGVIFSETKFQNFIPNFVCLSKTLCENTRCVSALKIGDLWHITKTTRLKFKIKLYQAFNMEF